MGEPAPFGTKRTRSVIAADSSPSAAMGRRRHASDCRGAVSARSTRCFDGGDLRPDAIEKPCSPMASSSSVNAGSPAISPQTLTCRAGLASLRMVARAPAPPDATGIVEVRDGLVSTDRWPACTGSGRWCRWRRSRSSAGTPARSCAAAGTSIIAPTSTSRRTVDRVGQLLGARQRISVSFTSPRWANHGDEQAHPNRRRAGPQDGPQLLAEHARLRTGSSGSPAAQRRVQRVLVAQLVHGRHAVQRLVGADVDRADRHRQPIAATAAR